jgi:hypothetical protein
MEKNLATIGLNRNSKRVCVAVCCVLVLLATSTQAHKVSALSTPRVSIEPTIAELQVGQIITVTVNLTDMPDLFLWQAVLAYNGSVLELTETSVPDNGVFAGHTSGVYGPEMADTEAPGDYVTKLNWTLAGANLYDDDSVSVSNGILFSAQFIALASGATTITLMTYANPVHTSIPATAADSTYYTFAWDSNLAEYNDFQTMGCTVKVGNVDVAPVAFFTVVAPTVDNTTNLVLPGLAKPNAVNPVLTYANYTTIFNATGSYAPFSNITQYIWDFGDGNVTTVNWTGPDSAIITHVYTHVGSYQVVLTVVSSNGLTATYLGTAVAGLVLPYYDWNPFLYTVAGLVAAVIVFYAVRTVVRTNRRRRELRMRKRLTAGPAEVPPTVA